MSKSLKRWMLGLSLFSVLPGVGLAALAQEQVAADQSLESDGDKPVVLTIGSKAPSIDVEHWVSDGHGKFKPVEIFEDGKVYVVEFWATWCGPCISSMPHLAQLQEEYADKNVQIISISDEKLEVVEAFLTKPLRNASKPTKKKSADENGDEDTSEESKDEPETYGKLTSAYSLTTDPDGSVKFDYMAAARQNGIPTAFLVGKTGHIEWIGHPMQMDSPLEKVVTDTWDREAFLKQFRKRQERDIVMASLRTKMQKGDLKGALKVLEEARKAAEGDEESVDAYTQLEFRLKATSAMQKIQTGELDEGLAELDELLETAEGPSKMQLTMLKLNGLLKAERHDEAAAVLSKITEAKEVTPAMLNQFAWGIYEAAKEKQDFSKDLIGAASAAAEKAVSMEPRNGMILDTFAHLVYLQGDLDRAIELQTQAVDNSDKAPAESQKEMKSFLETLNEEKAGK